MFFSHLPLVILLRCNDVPFTRGPIFLNFEIAWPNSTGEKFKECHPMVFFLSKVKFMSKRDYSYFCRLPTEAIVKKMNWLKCCNRGNYD